MVPNKKRLGRLQSLKLISSLFILTLYGNTPSHGIIAVEINSPYTADAPTGSVGWAFKVTALGGLDVTHVGFFDQFGNGLAKSHEVAIFSDASKAIVPGTLAVITASSPKGGPTLKDNSFFRYVKLKNPIPLQQDGSYRIVAFYPDKSGDKAAVIPTGKWVVNPNLVHLGAVGEQIPTAKLTYPDQLANIPGEYGPNFQFNTLAINPIPEPSLGILGGLCNVMVAAAFLRARHRKKQDSVLKTSLKSS